MPNSKILIFGAAGVVILVLALMLLGLLPGAKRNITTVTATLNVWGFDDSPEMWAPIIEAYGKISPSITIKYVKKDPSVFEEELINALAAGTGPDIFVFKQNWILKHKDKVFPLPEVSLPQFTKVNFERNFADIAQVFIQNKQIIALPIYVDTLALYYNKDILNSENIPNPPENWDELAEAAKKISKVSPAGGIIQSGIALGATKNIARAVDIISALFLQNGIKIIDLSGEEPKSDLGATSAVDAENVLAFYRSFTDSVRKTFSWSDSLPDSVQAFADGRTAMIIGFPEDYARITAKNSRLNFGVAPLPQPKGRAVKINYGLVTGLAVSRTSKFPLEAWKYTIYAASDPSAVQFYLNKSNHPPAFRQYANADFLAPHLAVFKGQILSARTWLQADEKKVSAIFQTMIQSVRGNFQGINQALNNAGRQLQELTKPFVPKPEPTKVSK